ncbi:MAG: nucleoside triphosphate pyrophosphohydrolase [Anaerolineae bacterium]
MSGGITIVGLGPGGSELWTQSAFTVLTESSLVYVRTIRHPGVEDIPGEVRSFDDLYEQADTFDQVYDTIAAEICRLGAEAAGVVYAVPGHPAVGEASVALIRQQAGAKGIPLSIVPGLSFIEPALAALGIDALDGLQLADATRLATLHYPPLDPDRPALVAQLYGRRLAGDVKLTLLAAYPPDYPITLIRAAGTPLEAQVRCALAELDRQAPIDHLTTLYLPPAPATSGLPAFQETIAHLRAPDGCPWDREQTHQSLRPYLLEETYEVLAALDADDPAQLAEELGDLLLQIVLHAQIASEEGAFLMGDVIRHIDQKIHRRHPHVFGDITVNGVSDVIHNWEAIKKQEKVKNGQDFETASVLDGVPEALPALAQALALSQRAVRAGFEWPDVDSLLASLVEEAQEIARAGDQRELEAEIGDLLFVVVNLARWLKVDPESALRRMNARFQRRFKQMEALAAQRQLSLEALDVATYEALWAEAKRLTAHLE